MTERIRYVGTLELGGGFYRIPEGWTVEEVLDDLDRSYLRSGGLGLRARRELGDRIAAIIGGADRNGPGRPPWSAPVFRDHWIQAIRRGGLKDGAPPELIAPWFEQLDGTIGIDADYLKRLRRRFAGG